MMALKDILYPFLLCALSVIFFRDILLAGHLLFGSDFVAFYLGMKKFLYSEWHLHRSIPYWNPYVFGGIPFWAHFESTIFYPLDLLFWIISPEKAFGYTVFFHLYLICLSMYLLGRTLGMGSSGSFLAAVVYGFNGLVMATLYDGQMYRLQAFAWIPLVICFLHLSMTRRRWFLYALWSGVTWGIQLLAGAPQDAFYTFIAAVLFIAFHMGTPPEGSPSHLRAVVVLGTLFLTGLGIAAHQLFPAFEFIGQSVRGAFDRYDFLTAGSYPIEGFITFFLPHFFGNYAKGDFWVSGVPWSIPLYNLYVGVLPIVLLFFLARPDWKKSRLVAFTLTLALVALVLAFGSHTPVYRLLALLPGFDEIRAPAKIIVLWAFAMALLAGRGLDDLLTHSIRFLKRRMVILSCFTLFLLLLNIVFHFEKTFVMKFFSPFILAEAIPAKLVAAQKSILSEFQRLTLFVVIIVLLLGLWCNKKIRTSFLVVLLLGLAVLDLSYVNRGAVQYNDGIYHWPATAKRELDRTIGKDQEIYRVGSFEFGMGPNIEMLLGYQTVGGYTPLFLQRYYEYINHYSEQTLPKAWVCFFYERHEKAVFMDLLNVKYEINYANRTITLRNGYLPRAMLVPRARLVEKKDILNELGQPDFDPTKTVLLEKGDLPPDHPYTPVAAESAQRPNIRIRTYRPDYIVLEIDSPWRGYLFLSEMFYPGWKAFVDRQRSSILRGNYLFRVIQIPQGKHEVRLVFAPLSIRLGIGVTLFTVLAVLLCTCLVLRKKSTRFKRSLTAFSSHHHETERSPKRNMGQDPAYAERPGNER
jgi:hypothetical protein